MSTERLELGILPQKFKGEARPVGQVCWLDAQEFCSQLSQLTGRKYRLPSEAEWEYACRAGTTTPFHFGETLTTDLANYNGNYTFAREEKGIDREETTPVGRFPPNGFGLYDIHGNVWEWCEDHYHSDLSEVPKDGSAWVDENAENDALRVFRGCSWLDYPGTCRSACRTAYNPSYRNDFTGFRVVCCTPRTIPFS